MRVRLSISFFLICAFPIYAQEVLYTLISKTPLEADRFVGVDDFGSVYFIKEAVLYKQEPKKTLEYNNLALGAIGNVDLLNPLDITVFYPGFNMAVKLDNTLNETTRVDFNRVKSFRTVRYATTGNDKNLWIFNADLNQLEVFNYQTQESIPIRQPLNETVIAQVSDYNFCWLLTEKRLLQYNYYGSLLAEIPAEGYEGIAKNGERLFLKKGNALFYRRHGDSIQPVNIPEILLKDFSVLGDNLYLYDGKILYHYHLNNLEKN